MSGITGNIVSGLFGLATTGINNAIAAERAREDRRENYMYGEMAAENADARTRALYNDFYSPKALMEQYKAAGLSPSLMFGGTPGQGGTTGAQGTGGAGIQTPFMPISLVETAQAAQLFAQTEKTKAETKEIQTETNIKKLEEELKELSNSTYKDTWNILNSRWEDQHGNQTSLFEMADKHYTFESFLEAVRKDEETGKTNFKASTEKEIETLRTIYYSASKFNRDIMVLSQETVSANFQISITNALNKKGFAEQNAETAIQQLKASAETAELTTSQKEAWNNLLDRLGKKGSTTRDIIVVLGMILGNFASHTGIKVTI